MGRREGVSPRVRIGQVWRLKKRDDTFGVVTMYVEKLRKGEVEGAVSVTRGFMPGWKNIIVKRVELAKEWKRLYV